MLQQKAQPVSSLSIQGTLRDSDRSYVPHLQNFSRNSNFKINNNSALITRQNSIEASSLVAPVGTLATANVTVCNGSSYWNTRQNTIISNVHPNFCTMQQRTDLAEPFVVKDVNVSLYRKKSKQ